MTVELAVLVDVVLFYLRARAADGQIRYVVAEPRHQSALRPIIYRRIDDRAVEVEPTREPRYVVVRVELARGERQTVKIDLDIVAVRIRHVFDYELGLDGDCAVEARFGR